MTDDPQDPLPGLRIDVRPPPALRARVHASLTQRGFLARAGPNRTLRAVLGVAAAALLVFLGYAAGRAPSHPPTQDGRFVLLLYESPGHTVDRPEAELVEEYSAWARSLGAAFELGEKLADESIVLGGTPTAEEGDVVAGFFVLRAANVAEARRLAQSCPHLRYGGRIVVRPIVPT